jgi:hypothetical protein
MLKGVCSSFGLIKAAAKGLLVQLSANQIPTPINKVPEIAFIHLILLPLLSRVFKPFPPEA